MTTLNVTGYSVLDVISPGGELKHYDMFIGKINNKLHLLGYRPTDCRAYFSENECSSLDFGIIELPDGRESLRDLVKGDIISVKKEDGKPGESNGFIYQGQS